jgi:hypothetical protein
VVVMKSIIFWDMTLCSPLSFNLLAGFSETISSTLKMEAICSFETSVETQLTTRRHIPEDDTLNISSYFLSIRPETLFSYCPYIVCLSSTI